MMRLPAGLACHLSGCCKCDSVAGVAAGQNLTYQVRSTEMWFAVSLAQRLQYLELRETRQNVGRVSCDGTEDGWQAVSLRSD